MTYAVEFHNVSRLYGDVRAVDGVSIAINDGEFFSMLGPSGSGKTTCLRLIAGFEQLSGGAITIFGKQASELPPWERDVNTVFQDYALFPHMSILDNVAYGPRIHGLARSRADLEEIVVTSLQKASLYNEVKDRLTEPGTGLSGGQQQRLCIARAIAVSPEVILMDEPCSALDPIATAKIEELIDELRANFTIVIVTHSMQQAARVSQRTAFFHLGHLIEEGPTDHVFTNPLEQRTLDYITGRFG